jgi:hypothetical protein
MAMAQQYLVTNQVAVRKPTDGAKPLGFRVSVHFMGVEALCFDTDLEVLILLELADGLLELV